jgi:hypothetical protein
VVCLTLIIGFARLTIADIHGHDRTWIIICMTSVIVLTGVVYCGYCYYYTKAFIKSLPIGEE